MCPCNSFRWHNNQHNKRNTYWRSNFTLEAADSQVFKYEDRCGHYISWQDTAAFLEVFLKNCMSCTALWLCYVTCNPKLYIMHICLFIMSTWFKCNILIKTCFPCTFCCLRFEWTSPQIFQDSFTSVQSVALLPNSAPTCYRPALFIFILLQHFCGFWWSV